MVEGMNTLTAFMNKVEGSWGIIKLALGGAGMFVLGSYALALILYGINAEINHEQDERIDEIINVVATSQAQHTAFLKALKKATHVETEDVEK